MFWDLQSAAKILNFKVLSTEEIFNINTAYSGFWIVKKKKSGPQFLERDFAFEFLNATFKML